jgi:signal transduction histidine kinase
MVHLAAMAPRLPGTVASDVRPAPRLGYAVAATLLLLLVAELAPGVPFLVPALLLGAAWGLALGLLISRRRAAAAAQAERRRVVRDLHDGAQQRLVHTIVVLKLARQAPDANSAVRTLMGEALDEAYSALRELRELASGGSPAALSPGGLATGLRELAERAPVPVSVDVSVGRLPSAVEAAAYFVVAEALTNVAKHARARTASVAAWLEAGVLHAEIRVDGVGGANPRGHGLTGLSERVAELDGELEVTTSAKGTRLTAAIPLVR